MEAAACRRDASKVDQYTDTNFALQWLNDSATLRIAHIEIPRGLTLEQAPSASFHVSSSLG